MMGGFSHSEWGLGFFTVNTVNSLTFCVNSALWVFGVTIFNWAFSLSMKGVLSQSVC